MLHYNIETSWLVVVSSASASTSTILSLSEMRASAAETFLLLIAQNLDVIATPLVTLLYPMYASIRAIETKSSIDDQQWLTYWVLYSMITLFEHTFASLIEWVPFWSYGKLILSCWLVIPWFSGAGTVYNHIVRPYLVTRQKKVNIWFVPCLKDVVTKPDDHDIITAADKYMQLNGTQAFENIIHRNNRETTLSTDIYTNKCTLYDDNYRYEDDHRY